MLMVFSGYINKAADRHYVPTFYSSLSVLLAIVFLCFYLVIDLSVLQKITISDYSFGIFKFFLAENIVEGGMGTYNLAHPVSKFYRLIDMQLSKQELKQSSIQIQ